MEQLYSLRKNFTIIGITGKTGSGCSEVARYLAQEDFNSQLNELKVEQTNDTDQLKLNVCINYLEHEKNWKHFKIIKYKHVLLFHLFYEATNQTNDKEEAIAWILDILAQNGDRDPDNKSICKKDKKILCAVKKILVEPHKDWYTFPKNNLTCETLKDCLKDKKDCDKLNQYYFKFFEEFADNFYTAINNLDLTKRIGLTHDLANNLRAYGTVKLGDKTDLENIYTVAETINRLIKNWKSKQGNEFTKIVIDSLKNSLELMFFKEKYSAFYTIAANKPEIERKNYVAKTIRDRLVKVKIEGKEITSEDIDNHVKNVLDLSEIEYKGGDVKDGKFASPDIENCIQKSDYHIYYSNFAEKDKQGFKLKQTSNFNSKEKELLNKEFVNYPELYLKPQLIKLIALIHQPGIITPTAYERLMQMAFNAKANSGCISRQVGAIVTDSSFSIKGVGWNDIPRFQIPCNLRSAVDLMGNRKNKDHFSDFEKGESGKYKDGQTFEEKFSADFATLDTEMLEGKICSFCFKSHHNAYEGEKNQVHTRSLHAEENAMLQISKYGGQGLKNGNLFTTASPCELCSKKAFQLGIKRIFYIDPYPGIATKHVLKNSKKEEERPQLIMFQGAVGRTFHKLFEPFMSYKDELAILTKVKPTPNKRKMVEDLTKDKDVQEQILSLL